jgi:hypothetical protein
VGKISFIVTGTVLAMFVMGRAESFLAHRGLGGSITYAQTWSDLGDEDSEQDDSKKAPPQIAGMWDGTAIDHLLGTGTFDLSIDQVGRELSGAVTSELGDGTFSGHIKPNGEIKTKFKVGIKCTLKAHATFDAGADEITGVYHASHCGKPDHGTFTLSPAPG